MAAGRALRAEIDGTDTPIGVLVVADGANTITPPRPAATTPTPPRCRNPSTTRWPGDADALTRLPDSIVGRVAYQVLAGLSGPGPAAAKEVVRRRALRGGLLRGHLDAMTPTAADRDHRPHRHRQIQLALAVADRLSGEVGVEVVNADAMQQYRGMDLGTAKLPPGERHGIPHHQLDVLDVAETATVARYQRRRWPTSRPSRHAGRCRSSSAGR